MVRERLRPGVALAGMGLAIAGIALENRTVVWGAMAVLAVAFLLRFWKPTAPAGADPEAPSGS